MHRTTRPIATFVSLAAASGAALSADDWWRDAVFYEVFVRSFADSTEGPLANDGVGDIRGLIDRLDYLNDGDPETDIDLGVTGIWLMPVFQSPSYHGYDVTDYRRIDDEYGTNKDFRELVEACHERGIRVIVDLVINHCSSQHPWFEGAADPDAPTHDWFVWAETPPTGPGAPQHTVWHGQKRATTGKDYYGFFWHGMPDLNLRNPGATAAVKDAARYWIEDIGLDGFRMDAIKHLIEDGVVFENTPETVAWLADYHAYLHGLDPGLFTVGEVWSGTPEVAEYVGRSVDSAFEFDTCFAIERALNAGLSGPVVAQLVTLAETYEQHDYSTFLGNHDMDRTMSRLGGDEGKMKAAVSVLLTMPGIPFLYYGEEIGHTGTKPDPDLRTPMQWTGDAAKSGFSDVEPWKAPQANTPEVNVEAQTSDPGSLLSHVRTMIALRNDHEALRRGDLRVVRAEDPEVAAFVRETAGERLLVLVNFSGRGVESPTVSVGPGVSSARAVLSTSRLQGPPTAEGWSPVERLGPHECVVLELE